MIRPLRRLLLASVAAGLCAVAAAGPALACAGLVTPGGNVKLLRASTLAAWADGYEHYVTSFTFQGGGAEFGSIVPLPGIPSKVERGGDWTLQRLEREVAPPAPAAARDCANCAEATAGSAEELYNTRIDALDITILRGGGASVGQWAREHGFQLTPDAPEVLDFYAARSPIFMAARFNADAAKDRNQDQGEGTPVHLTIPLDQPWVPLRILGLGKGTDDLINANVFLLTPSRPNLLPEPQNRSSNPGARPVAGSDEVGGDGVVLERSEPASKSLLDDLRSDKGMEWVPQEMWLTYLRIGEQTTELDYDLAIDKAGAAKPSRVLAGLDAPPPAPTTTSSTPPTTAAPTSTTAKPKPKPTPPKPVPTPTTASPALPVPTPVTDPTLPVIVESPDAAAAAQSAQGPQTVALPSASPASDDDAGMSPAALIAAAGAGALAAGLAAWTLQNRRRRTET
ncbi:MAG TPA: DUF2330 domain-containing protein [Acidimicrobiia bacterium]|nr:DUF2330 domain-containing protein [Acidimicrobiia bacterium]